MWIENAGHTVRDSLTVMLTAEEKERIRSLFSDNSGFDAWGTSMKSYLKVSPVAKFFFENYFRVSVKGMEKIPEGPVLFIANHGGQIPIDAALIVYSLMMKAPKPRITRGMVERWVPTLPFVGSLFTKLGQVVGDQKNCLQLLKKGQSVLVFPEGVKGCGKTIFERYQLQHFTMGSYRLALEAHVPIVPIAVFGAEEAYPSLMNLAPLAKILRAPYFPITPTFPLLGPLGLIPLPSKITLNFLEPHNSPLSVDASDDEVTTEIEKIKLSIQQTLNESIAARGEHVFSGAAN